MVVVQYMVIVQYTLWTISELVNLLFKAKRYITLIVL